MLRLRNMLFATLLVLFSLPAFQDTASAQDIHPAVDVETGCLLGGVVKGNWLEDVKIAPMLKGGERYRLYTSTGSAGEASGAKPESSGAPCEETQVINFTPETKEGIAVGGDWNAQPRVAQALNVNNPEYRQVVTGILRKHGIPRPKINITQILRVDLEGDGTEEVLISATYLAGGIGSADSGMAFRVARGDYSFVVLRKIVNGKVRDLALAEEYYPRKMANAIPTKYKVAGLLDLNGDGKMEVIIHMDYYEGSSSSVFRIDGSKATNVFGCGCGA